MRKSLFVLVFLFAAWFAKPLLADGIYDITYTASTGVVFGTDSFAYSDGTFSSATFDPASSLNTLASVTFAGCSGPAFFAYLIADGCGSAFPTWEHTEPANGCCEGFFCLQVRNRRVRRPKQSCVFYPWESRCRFVHRHSRRGNTRACQCLPLAARAGAIALEV